MFIIFSFCPRSSAPKAMVSSRLRWHEKREEEHGGRGQTGPRRLCWPCPAATPAQQTPPLACVLMCQRTSQIQPPPEGVSFPSLRASHVQAPHCLSWENYLSPSDNSALRTWLAWLKGWRKRCSERRGVMAKVTLLVKGMQILCQQRLSVSTTCKTHHWPFAPGAK